MSLLRCTLWRQNRLPNLHSVDRVALRIDREFPQPQADCKDLSRRSETATVSHAACSFLMKTGQEAVQFVLGSRPQLVKEENQRKRPAPFILAMHARRSRRFNESVVELVRQCPCRRGHSMLPAGVESLVRPARFPRPAHCTLSPA